MFPTRLSSGAHHPVWSAGLSGRVGPGLLVCIAALLSTGSAVAASDTIVRDIAARPQYVDPVMGVSAQANVTVAQDVYGRLVWCDGPDRKPIPWLATGWEAKDNGQRSIFKLRKGIKFRDGSDFDAHAVKFSFDRAVLIDDPTGRGGTRQPERDHAEASGLDRVDRPNRAARLDIELRRIVG